MRRPPRHRFRGLLRRLAKYRPHPIRPPHRNQQERKGHPMKDRPEWEPLDHAPGSDPKPVLARSVARRFGIAGLVGAVASMFLLVVTPMTGASAARLTWPGQWVNPAPSTPVSSTYPRVSTARSHPPNTATPPAPAAP